jgi:hypothetical protein
MGPLGGAVPCKDATTASEDEDVPNFPMRRVQAGEEERTVVRGDRARAMRGEEDRVADRRGRLVSGARARKSEGERGLAGGVERQRERRAHGAGWRARGSRPEVGREGRELARAGRERPRVWARNWPSQGKVSLFFISYFHFLFLFLLSPFFLNN